MYHPGPAATRSIGELQKKAIDPHSAAEMFFCEHRLHVQGHRPDEGSREMAGQVRERTSRKDEPAPPKKSGVFDPPTRSQFSFRIASMKRSCPMNRT